MLTFAPITVFPSVPKTNTFDPFLNYPICSTTFKTSINSMKHSNSFKRSISTQTDIFETKNTILLTNAALQLIQISDEIGEYLESIKKLQQSNYSFISKLFSFLKFAFLFFL